MSTAAELVVKIVTDVKDATKGVDAAASKYGKFKSGVSAAAKGAGVALAGLTVLAVDFAQAAADDEQGQAVLANTLKRTTGATTDQIKAVEDHISAMSKATGVADDDLRPALAALARGSGSVTKAQKDLKTAMDISAATGKPLQSVADAIAKGYSGQTTSLGRLVPGISKAALASKNFTRILGDAKDMTKGAAAAAADTAAGKYKKMQVSIQEAKESLGAALLPVMAKFSDLAAKMASVIGDNTGAFQIIAGVIAAVATAIIALNFALKAYDIILRVTKLIQEATWLAALGPIGLVVLAIGAVIAIFVLLYTKVKWFRDFVNAAWRVIKHTATAVARAIKQAWIAAFNALKPAMRAVGTVFKVVWRVVFAVVKTYIRAWVAYFRLVFGVIKNIVKIFIGIFKGDWRGVLNAVKDIIRGFRDFFRDLFGALPNPVQKVITKIKTGLGGAITWLVNKLSGIGDTLADPFVAITDALGDAIQAVEDLIGWIGKIHIPDVGGFIDKIMPGMAPAPPTSTRGVAAAVPTAGGRATTSSGGGITINVNGALDPESVARQIRRVLDGHDRRVGLRTA